MKFKTVHVLMSLKAQALVCTAVVQLRPHTTNDSSLHVQGSLDDSYGFYETSPSAVPKETEQTAEPDCA